MVKPAATTQVSPAASGSPKGSDHSTETSAWVPPETAIANARVDHAPCAAKSRRTIAIADIARNAIITAEKNSRTIASGSSSAGPPKNTASQAPDTAARNPSGSSTRPARRCHPRRARSAGENWNAPTRQYTLIDTMCATIATVDAHANASLEGTLASRRLSAPPMIGSALSRSRPLIASHPLRGAGRGSVLVCACGARFRSVDIARCSRA